MSNYRRNLWTQRDLTPRPWDRVSVFWERMLAWARQKDVIVSSPGARIKEGIYGTRIILESRESWNHPFRVSLRGMLVDIGTGYVDAQMPTIGGIGLDGSTAEGDQGDAPTLDLSEEKAGSDGRSMVCIAMSWDVSAQAARVGEDDWLSVLHVSDLDQARVDSGPVLAYMPLAIIYWQEGKPAYARQLVTHNLQHVWLKGVGLGAGKHFFTAI